MISAVHCDRSISAMMASVFAEDMLFVICRYEKLILIASFIACFPFNQELIVILHWSGDPFRGELLHVGNTTAAESI